MEKRNFYSLKEDIDLIIEIPERIKTIDIIHLKEFKNPNNNSYWRS